MIQSHGSGFLLMSPWIPPRVRKMMPLDHPVRDLATLLAGRAGRNVTVYKATQATHGWICFSSDSEPSFSSLWTSFPLSPFSLQPLSLLVLEVPFLSFPLPKRPISPTCSERLGDLIRFIEQLRYVGILLYRVSRCHFKHGLIVFGGRIACLQAVRSTHLFP